MQAEQSGDTGQPQYGGVGTSQSSNLPVSQTLMSVQNYPMVMSDPSLNNSPVTWMNPSVEGSPMVWISASPYVGSPMVISTTSPTQTVPGNSEHQLYAEWMIGLQAAAHSIVTQHDPHPLPHIPHSLQILRECCPLLHRLLEQCFCNRARTEEVFSEFVKEAAKTEYGGVQFSMIEELVNRRTDISCINVFQRLDGGVDIILVEFRASWSKYLAATLYPISLYASEHAPMITSSRQLGKAVESDNPFEELRCLSSPWSDAILHLIQMQLDQVKFTLHSVLFPVDALRSYLGLLQKLVRIYHRLPRSFYVSEVTKSDQNPIAGGGFSDVWKGRLHDQIVCLKVLRVFTASSHQDKVFAECCHEAVIWKQLNNPNILPFIGINMGLFAPRFCLISPWMPNGNIIEHLSRQKKLPGDSEFYHNVRTIEALLQVATGMRYLHSFSPPIVHGDIRGANILVDASGKCRLADFGLAQVAETTGFKDTYSVKGAIRWLAPEVLSPSLFPDFVTPSSSFARDVYAFGCTAYEIATLDIPFPELKVDGAVILAVLSGKRPARSSRCNLLQDHHLWSLIVKCWTQQPWSRPTAADVVRCLLGLPHFC